MAFLEFNKKFPAEEAALDYFYLVKYNNILTCPRCGKNQALPDGADKSLYLP